MALINSKRQRFVLLSVLYCAQGLPRGFMAVTIISYLTGTGVADAVAGKLAATIAIPWALKFMWAPVIDTVAIVSMGRRRPWIIIAQLMMALTLVAFLTLHDPINNIALLGWVFFAHNCFAALQDVCSDALAIDVLPKEELETANGLMMGSKLVGIGLGAAAFAPIMQHWGMRTAVMVQIVLLISIMLLPLFILERPGEKLMPWSPTKTTKYHLERNVVSPLRVLRDLRRAFAIKAIAALALLGCVTATSEWIVDVINKPFYTKVLGWTFVKFSGVSGALLVLQFAAALAGGWVANRIGPRFVLLLGLGGYGIMTIVFGAFSQLWVHSWVTIAFLLFPPAANAFGSVAFFSMAMRISWTRSAATVFTSMMAITSLGHVIGGWMIGPLRDGLGFSYQTIFCLGGALMIAPLFLLTLIGSDEVDQMKLAEL